MLATTKIRMMLLNRETGKGIPKWVSMRGHLGFLVYVVPSYLFSLLATAPIPSVDEPTVAGWFAGVVVSAASAVAVAWWFSL